MYGILGGFLPTIYVEIVRPMRAKKKSCKARTMFENCAWIAETGVDTADVLILCGPQADIY